MSVSMESPYGADGSTWLRGNLHTHSTRSDGRCSVQEMVRAYGKLGYDFLSISDHDVLSDYTGVDPCGMVLIAGNEVSFGGPHVLDVGATSVVASNANHQLVLDTINQRGGFPVLCHPSWESGYNHYSFEMLHSLKDYVGIEIFNGGVLDGPGSHLATDKWDRLLATGRRAWGFANDDAHGLAHVGRGWNVVKVSERTPEAVVAALKAGAFYASSGVRIERIECDGPNLLVVAPNADRIAAFGTHGRREAVADGQRFQFDVSAVTGAFVRVECYGRGGEMAWTQPLAIRGGVHERTAAKLRELESGGRASLEALRADRAPVISGRVDDPLWQAARPFDAFIRLNDAAPAAVKTEVRCIAGGGRLTFGLRCDEPDLEHLKTTLSRQGMWSADSVEIFLDVEGKATSCYHMVVNPYGDSYAGSRGPRASENPATISKSGRYESDGRRGWSAEISVALADLGASDDPGTRWGLHLCRNRCPVRDTYVWSWVGPSNHNKHLYGTLVL